MEILGTIASIIILISFLMKGERKIRAINLIGSIIFLIYGIMIKSFSVFFLNTVLSIVHIHMIIKGK